MSGTDIHHLAAAYALDAVDDRERAAFEAHYPTCDVCRADVVDFRETLGRLAEADPVPPPADVRARVLAEIAQTRQLSPLLPEPVSELAERRRRRRRIVSGVLAAAAAVAVFAAGALVVDRSDTPAFAEELADVLEQPDARFLTVAATPEGGADGTVRVAWSDRADRAVLLGDGLAEAPAGQGYELWLIDESGPVPMRVLDPADGGELRAVVDIDAAPVAWGVTLEPAGGSPAPTGDILFLTEL